MSIKMLRALLIALVPHLLLLGCAAPERLAALPEDRTTEAQIAGMPNIRYWVDEETKPFVQEVARSLRREWEYRASTGQTGPLPPTYFLAVSGGGDNGAFGAGLSCNWSAAGNRPEFNGVTCRDDRSRRAPSGDLEHDGDRRGRHAASLQLFRKILAGSAAIPGAFPPVMIDVEVGGTRYREMHVDGGAMAQVFL
jgi:hypothetical protein